MTWIELQIIREELQLLRDIKQLLTEIRDALNPRLATFSIQFGGTVSSTLTKKVGETVTATIVNPIGTDGNPFPLDLTATPPTWTLSDPNVASQSPSLDGSDAITALAPGTETITATVGGISATATLTVEQVVTLASFEVSLA